MQKVGSEFVDLAYGSWAIEARRVPFARSPTQQVVLEAEQDAIDLELHLRDGAMLHGTVFDPEGQPLVGASVSVRTTEDEGDQRSQRQHTTSGADGQYEFVGLDAGEHSVTFRPGRGNEGGILFAVLGSQPDQVHVELDAGEVRELHLYLDPGAVVEGSVLLGEQGLGGVEVGLRAVDNPLSRRTVTADDEGRYRFDEVGAGSWRVFAQPEGAGVPTSEELTVATGERLVVDLHLSGGAIRGRVLEDGTGRPLSAVTVKAERPGEPPDSSAFTYRIARVERAAGSRGRIRSAARRRSTTRSDRREG